MEEHNTGKNYFPIFSFVFLSSFLLYVWAFSKTPYGLDDWSWGSAYGMRMFLSGGLNSRYVGNLLEIIVTRSEFLKAVLLGAIAASIPFLIVIIAMKMQSNTQPSPSLGVNSYILPTAMLLLANILFLTLPIDVWQQTYGWIAGFSNYGLAVLSLVVFQLLLFRALFLDKSNNSLAFKLGYFIFSICVQLVLENMSIYVFLTDFFILIILLFKKKNKTARDTLLVMLVGNLIGLAIMFSSSIYESLLNTGHAIGNYRSMSFDRHDGILKIIILLYQRFVYFYPNHVFENNWVISSMISALILIFSRREKRKIFLAFRIFTLAFSIYFLFVHFFGPLEDYILRWNEVLTQRLNLMFFWGILLAVILCPWGSAKIRKILIFVWLSVPGVVLPLVAVKMVAARYFLLSSLFLIEFCLLLFSEVYSRQQNANRFVDGVLLLAFLIVSIHRFSVYYEIGQGKKERDELIRAAQKEEINRLYFPDLPHKEYIYIVEPLDGSEQVPFFRRFYKIPDSVEMHNSPEDFSSQEE